MIIVFLSFIVILVYQLVIRPYIKARPFVKHGFKYYYSFLTGILGTCQENVKVHGNYFHSFNLDAKDKNCKGLVSNIANDIVVFLYDSNLKKEMLDKPHVYFKYNPNASEDIFKAYVGNSMLIVDGEKWRVHRKIASSFLHHDNLKKIIASYGKYFRASFENLKNQNLINVNIMDKLREIISHAASNTFFGRSFENYPLEGQPFCLVTSHLTAELGIYRFAPSFLFFRAKQLPRFLFKEQHDFINKIRKVKAHGRSIYRELIADIEKFRKAGKTSESKNLLETLYEYRLENPNSEVFTEEDVMDEFLLVFTASYETSARLFTNALYFLDKHPHYKTRLLEEIDLYYDINNITIEQLNKMSFMHAFLNECYRLHPLVPSPFTREAIQDDVLGGIPVKKGTKINVLWDSSNRNPTYHEEPERFYPERWLDPDSLTMRSYAKDPFIFQPFSTGPRGCIGKVLANHESKILFSEFLKNFDFEVANKNFDSRLTLRFLLEFTGDMLVNLIPK